ncbi:XVIPCD domain-containing protein [Lysobacter antibioticus]|uniref:XVIPCD domain-containing protein n=1 Tax=Lysobacter antibioticus TaxID=84531 RepID=UPI00034D4B2A|nr:XVIPCD domain-containing protein [Lysobacter antibioticus]
MNAAVDSISAGNRAQTTTAALRRYAGQGSAQERAQDYTVLLPADDEWSRDSVLRAVVADALQRNGQVVDEDTLEATVAQVGGPGGALAQLAPAWKLHPGETRADGRVAPPFHGYALDVPATLQDSMVDYAKRWSAQRDAGPQAPVDAPLNELRQLARNGGRGDVADTLDAIDGAIKAGTAARASGQPIDAAAMSALMEFAHRTGRERQAAKILERYTAIKDVGHDVRDLGQNAGRVFNGRDPVSGRPLDTDQRVDAAFDMLSGGFKLAGSVGNTAVLLGARNAGLVGSLIGIAPVGMAIVAFAAGAFELIKRAREALLAPRWDEFRERFPFAQGMEPKRAISAVMRQIEGMPTDAGNALSTATRILDGVGQNPETRERFLSFLKQKVPESLVDALASGQGLEKLSAQQQMLLAQAAKNSSKEFFDLELKDVKRYVADRDGQRERGTYLLPPELREAANHNGNRVGGGFDEGLRVAGILSSGAHAMNGLYKELLGKVQGGELNRDLGRLGEQQQKNLAAALIPAMRDGGLSQIDHLLASKDGSRLFAVQGDPQSPSRRMVAIDVSAAAHQSVEASSLLVARQMATMETQNPQTQLAGGRGL